MKTIFASALVAAALSASPALAQQQGSQSGATEPPGGSHQGYLGQDERLGDQTAQMPEQSRPRRVDPGTLRKFNSNSGYGPEVQFDVDRREEAQRQQQLRQGR